MKEKEKVRKSWPVTGARDRSGRPAVQGLRAEAGISGCKGLSSVTGSQKLGAGGSNASL